MKEIILMILSFPFMIISIVLQGFLKLAIFLFFSIRMLDLEIAIKEMKRIDDIWK